MYVRRLLLLRYWTHTHTHTHTQAHFENNEIHAKLSSSFNEGRQRMQGPCVTPIKLRMQESELKIIDIAEDGQAVLVRLCDVWRRLVLLILVT